jgi:hypothetical protein
MPDANILFDHVHLISEGPQAAAAWYVDKLGGEIVRSMTCAMPRKLMSSSTVLPSSCVASGQVSKLAQKTADNGVWITLASKCRTISMDTAKASRRRVSHSRSSRCIGHNPITIERDRRVQPQRPPVRPGNGERQGVEDHLLLRDGKGVQAGAHTGTIGDQCLALVGRLAQAGLFREQFLPPGFEPVPPGQAIESSSMMMKVPGTVYPSRSASFWPASICVGMGKALALVFGGDAGIDGSVSAVL